jgi:hypothetical protein
MADADVDDATVAPTMAASPAAESRRDSIARGFRILSPLDGDRYSIPVGIEARYATIPLRAAGGEKIEWSIDGKTVAAERWALEPGEHVIEAVASGGKTARVRIIVR